MTTVADMIIDGYRESNLVAEGQPLNTNQTAVGLRRLQVIASSVYGNEMGEKLQLFPLGANNVSVPSGYPWGNGNPPQEWWVPLNSRLVCNLTMALSSPPVYLHPAPQDGTRLGVVDASGNFATYPLTLAGNGRKIEGLDQVTLNEDGTRRDWVYRADLGEWKRVTPIEPDGDWPWPDDFDDMFICMLAMRLNPRYGQSIGQDSIAALERSRGQFKARYTQIVPTPTPLELTQYSAQTYRNNRNPWGPQPSTGDSGWAWPIGGAFGRW